MLRLRGTSKNSLVLNFLQASWIHLFLQKNTLNKGFFLNRFSWHLGETYRQWQSCYVNQDNSSGRTEQKARTLIVQIWGKVGRKPELWYHERIDCWIIENFDFKWSNASFIILSVFEDFRKNILFSTIYLSSLFTQNKLTLVCCDQ